MFLLPAETQIRVIGSVARVLSTGRYFLFTSPSEVCSWTDGMTGLLSVSLGHEDYDRALATHGLMLTGNDRDEGENFYYFAERL